ncbi:MAG: iron ABC transporter permease [Actinobacteria bacterium]|nr:iron ABC transporter permease [Actinomycetota bacterium]
MELTTARTPAPPAAAAPRRARVSGWVVASGAIAIVMVAPLLALPASFFRGGVGFDTLARLLLPDALRTSLLLAGGVGIGTLLVGGGLAVLISFYDFPGRKWLDWALVLPMAMPGYVLVFVVLGLFDVDSPLQSSLFGSFHIPGIRTTFGGICILTAVLYPYVYVLGRSAFLGQSRQTLEAARSLGRSRGGAIRSVALPLARPALAGGVALAVMEALADFGTVNLLGIRALTNAIYRVWNGAFDEASALQLATVLLTLTLALITIERLLRGRARYNQSLARGDAVEPQPLRGWKRWLAPVAPCLLLAVVFVIPVAQLVAWSLETIREGTTVPNLRDAVWNTVFLGVITAAIAPVIAIVLVYGMRLHGSRTNRVFTRLSTVGYAIPGTVIAVAVYVPLVWLDRRFVDFADSAFDASIDLIFTGSILGLVFAYLVRFNALSFMSTDARMQHVDPRLDDAARSLGADRARVLADVHLPLLRPGLIAGALLVLVEVMKELPATALLRPLGRDTLAITVWEATKDSRLDAAALPALLIVLIGLVPVIVLVRLLRAEGWTSAADQFG